jgi:CHAT domain-containing protein/predicted negative regulator of RcsB-dependent stress response
MIFAAIIVAATWGPAGAETRAFVPPPRTIADITAILDNEKPDPAKTAQRRNDANAQPPAGAGGMVLASFLFKRAQARAEIGRMDEAIADLEKALATDVDPMADLTNRIRLTLLAFYRQAGEHRRGLPLLAAMEREYNRHGRYGRLFGIYRGNLIISLVSGDVGAAEANFQKAQALLARSQGWQNVERFRSAWAAQVEDMAGRLFEARGKYSAAEAAYRKSHGLWVDAMAKSATWSAPPPRSQMELSVNLAIAFEGRTKTAQGRMAEGEADARRALLGHLRSVGKYNSDTPTFLNFLAKSLTEQGRYQEAEKLSRTSVEIYEALGYRDETQAVVGSLALVIGTLSLQSKYEEEKALFLRIDAATKNWEPARIAALRLDGPRAYMEYFAGDVERGIALARNQVGSVKAQFGEKHFNHALAQGILAVGLTRAGRGAEALREFRAALPTLLMVSRENEDDDQSVVAARDLRLAAIIEHYMVLLARSPSAAGDVAVESFRLADIIRGRSVQKALSASSARASISDPVLAELVRNEQDLAKQVQAQVGSLNNTLALPPGERDDKTVRELNAQINTLRAERNLARQEIGRRFPNYADLIDPKPPTVEEIKASLKPEEALLSFYFGRRASFAWAVPKNGAVAFAMVPGNAHSLETKIRKLREALEPQASMVSEIPPFDLALAHELYTLLLKPVETGWKGAKNLIVVTNGALGLLPLSLLPTGPAPLKADDGPMFATYRDVPWLARTHAVTMIPSASALRMLRHLPAGSDKRERMIGFGDPYFSVQQAAQTSDPTMQTADASMRGIPLRRRAAPQTQGVDSAELALLPRLPDTADELRSIALALQADPAKVLHLGKQANERTVKSAALARYRVVVFATHGLVPGELNGLTQPALALTAPDVADVDGDGLLTMEEILALKLDADWVVLSACNTGAGAGAGAEAASGLGRAFFYAGTRALLITNWSVHSQSARELVSDMFRRQAADARLTRAEALRQAMMALLDGKGFSDDRGKTSFTYGHPLFWAPYTIVGDGGRL